VRRVLQDPRVPPARREILARLVKRVRLVPKAPRVRKGTPGLRVRWDRKVLSAPRGT